MKKLSFLIFLVVASCGGQVESNKVQHPTKQNLPLVDGKNVKEVNKNPSELIALNKLAGKFKQANMEVHIGGSLGNDTQLIGEIVSADINDDEIFLLDKSKKRVIVYDRNGNYKQSFSDSGRGPGELINPGKIIVKEDTVFILDDQFGVEIFTKDRNSYTYYNNLDVDIRPDDICLSKDGLVVNTIPVTSESSDLNSDNILVYKNSNNSQILNTFSNLYKSNKWHVIMSMSMGGVSCSLKSSTILHYFNNLPYVYGFSSNGEKTKTLKISDFEQLILFENGNTLGPDQQDPPNKFDIIDSILPVTDDYYLVQVKNLNIVDGAYQNFFDTYIIDAVNAEGVFVSDTLGKVVSVDHNNKSFFVFSNSSEDHPFPHIQLYRYR